MWGLPKNSDHRQRKMTASGNYGAPVVATEGRSTGRSTEVDSRERIREAKSAETGLGENWRIGDREDPLGLRESWTKTRNVVHRYAMRSKAIKAIQ